MLKRLKVKLVNKLLAYLTYTVNPDNVCKMDNLANIYLNGRKIDGGEADSLHHEAISISKTRLWRILHDTLISQAQDIMFKNSTNWEDMQGGKYMLRNLDVQKKIIDTLIDYKKK